MDDDILEVGLTVSIETEYKYYISTHIIGWERDVYFLTGLAHDTGKKSHLKVNTGYKIRFLREGMACGFESKILAVNVHPYPMMFFNYPRAVEQLQIRKFNRVKTGLAAQLLDQDEAFIADAVIKDLSEGGCSLTVPIRRDDAITHDRSYKLSFTALETNLRLSCAIRKIKTGRDSHCLGIEFCDLTPEEKEKINIFMDICSNIFTSRLDFILSKMKDSAESLSGHIEEMSVTDILQILDQMNKEGALHIITKPHNGYIAVSKGRIMDVFMDDLQGEDALACLISLKEGLFHFKAGEITSGRFKKPLQLTLMETCRLLDERTLLGDAFPGEHDTLVLLKDPGLDDAETRAIVRAIRSGASNITELSAVTGMAAIRSGLIAAQLIKDGFLLKVS